MLIGSGSDEGYKIREMRHEIGYTRDRIRGMGSGEDVVGEYEGRPLSGLWTHHRRPKAGPSIQSSQRERNPKGSH